MIFILFYIVYLYGNWKDDWYDKNDDYDTVFSTTKLRLFYWIYRFACETEVRPCLERSVFRRQRDRWVTRASDSGVTPRVTPTPVTRGTWLCVSLVARDSAISGLSPARVSTGTIPQALSPRQAASFKCSTWGPAAPPTVTTVRATRQRARQD